MFRPLFFLLLPPPTAKSSTDCQLLIPPYVLACFCSTPLPHTYTYTNHLQSFLAHRRPKQSFVSSHRCDAIALILLFFAFFLCISSPHPPLTTASIIFSLSLASSIAVTQTSFEISTWGGINKWMPPNQHLTTDLPSHSIIAFCETLKELCSSRHSIHGYPPFTSSLVHVYLGLYYFTCPALLFRPSPPQIGPNPADL